MRVNLFARGREYYDTLILLNELGFVCKENDTDTSAMCLHYGERIAFRVNQMNDTDKDGVPDGVDCKPFDPMFQDYLFGGATLNPNVGDTERTFNGYKLDDYYFSDGNWHVRPGAKPVFKTSWLGRLRKK